MGGPSFESDAVHAGARRFLSYLAVGALATAVHFALLVAGVEWGRWPAFLASGVAAVIGAQVAYLGNRCMTFAYTGPVVSSWLRFQLTALAGAGVGMLVVALAVQGGLHYLLGQALATGMVVLLTYMINRRWAFGSRLDRA